MSNTRIRRWAGSIGVMTLWLAGCEAASTSSPAKSSPPDRKGLVAASATTTAKAAPPPAPSHEPAATPSGGSLPPCPEAVRAELNRLATCFHQAVTALQREPDTQPLGAFLKQAALPGNCGTFAQNGEGTALGAGTPVAVARSESHDNYGEGHVAFLMTYRFSLPHCRHTATTAVNRHIGGRP